MRTNIDRRSLLTTVGATLLAGCGGGGQGKIAAAPPPPPPPPPAPTGAVARGPVLWSRTFAQALRARDADPFAAYDWLYSIEHARLGAMAFLAGHDAVNAVQRRYTPFAYAPSPDAQADATLAYAVALSEVLRTEMADNNAENLIDQSLQAALASVPEGVARSRAIEIGEAAAAAVMAARFDDGSAWPHGAAVFDATAGVFRPELGALLEYQAWFQGWGQVRPFTTPNPLPLFRAAPADLASPDYAAHFAEVKAKGRATDSTRTADESEVARFWSASPSIAWQLIAAQWLPSATDDLWFAARWCALIQMAIADAEIAAVEAQYHYRRWRPLSAIREADIDGNLATTPDAAWASLLYNLEFTPAYPSVHGAGAWAPTRLMAELSGGSPASLFVPSAVLVIGRVLRVPDIYDTVWTEAAREMSEARLWGGLCDREAVNAGKAVGISEASMPLHQLLPALP
jgi:hypothetical protein